MQSPDEYVAQLDARADTPLAPGAVTEAMIRAGVDAYIASIRRDRGLRDDVASIYRAMHTARPLAEGPV